MEVLNNTSARTRNWPYSTKSLAAPIDWSIDTSDVARAQEILADASIVVLAERHKVGKSVAT